MKNRELSRICEKKCFIFDMDGTIYLGERVFPKALSLIRRLRRMGKRVIFYTNNASRSPVRYVERLSRLGFEPTPEEILTAGEVTVDFLLRERAGKSVYLMGTPDLEAQFRAAGIDPLPHDVPDADIVVTSFDTTLTYEKLDAACRCIRRGAEYLCTHPDFNCPTEDGFIPDSGAIAAAVTASTGVKPTYFGKPYGGAIAAISARTGYGAHEMCMFGDRLYTDIAFGKRGGVLAVLMLTGETSEQTALAADDADKPDVILPDFGPLLDALNEHETEDVNDGV
ncbi:MAG: HAD-IIA family hydrolase [Clostridia bacterium]|nr:HAD-IIA family hydrolase [Clostridia bacterium]MBQ7339151.1 HAD-IIA family hydrolase [Clostridia bacterium]